MPAQKFRVTCNTLMKKLIFWYPLISQLLLYYFQNIRSNKVNKNIFSVLFLSQYTHHCIAGKLLDYTASEDYNLSNIEMT